MQGVSGGIVASRVAALENATLADATNDRVLC